MSTRPVPVVVVGAGPVGVTIANLLGTYGIETLVIERSPDILDYPRAVGLDDEALRTLQAAGLADEMLRDMIQNVPMRMYTGRRRLIAEILPTTREFGWFRRNLFSQPLGERTLRRGLERFPQVELRTGVELTDLRQDADGVTLAVRDDDGRTSEIVARYVVAADGGRSTVRERLLRVPFTGRTHPHKWVVIECDDDPLDAPYTALHCDPRRPFVCLALPYGLRRWEFLLFPGEDAERILDPVKVRELLAGHVPDPARLRILRARVYTHHSRLCDTFVVGRVCLAGDAAHLSPPWIGQGLNAGLRDAFNLAWKLSAVVDGRMPPSVVETYGVERHAHAKAMIELADLFGSILSITNRPLAAVRDRLLLWIGRIPRLRDHVLQMRFKPMPRYRDGVVLDLGSDAQRGRVGRMFVQPQVETADGRLVALDRVLGDGFALLLWRTAARDVVDPALAGALVALGCRTVEARRARSGTAAGAGSAIGIEDAQNLLGPWFGQAQADWVLIRPDRHVAAIGTRDTLHERLTTFVARFAVPFTADAPSAADPVACRDVATDARAHVATAVAHA